jgi:hypothetical protein
MEQVRSELAWRERVCGVQLESMRAILSESPAVNSDPNQMQRRDDLKYRVMAEYP